jgi:hypothetical protein
MSNPSCAASVVGRNPPNAAALPSNSSETINLAGTDYVLVPKPILKRENTLEAKSCESKDSLSSPRPVTQTVSVPHLLHPRVLAYRKAAQRGFVRGKNMMIADVLLTQKFSVTSAGSVDLTTVSALQPGSLSEFTSYQALFDLCRCKAIRIHTSLSSSSTAATGNSCGFIAFDPASNAAMTSTAQAMESRYGIGPFKVSNLFGNQAPNVLSKSGFWTWKAKLPTDMFESGASGDKVGSEWWPTATTSAVIGYLKPFIESVGSPTITIVHFVEYEMQFAYRT